MAPSLTWNTTEPRWTQEPHSEPMSSKQAGETYDGQHRSAGERANRKRRANDQAKLGPPSDGPNLMQGGYRTEMLEDNSVQDASKKYARKPRHKTKPDRYEYKDASGKPSKKKETTGRAKTRPATLLNPEFQAPNVAIDRLTLKPNSGPGFLAKGKSSTATGDRGLPDLTFSEMQFLKRKRQDDEAHYQKLKKQSPRKKSRRPRSQEIPEFFSRATELRREGKGLPNPPSTESYVSWSVSPLQNRAPYRRLSSAARSHKSESTHLHEAYGLIGPSKVRSRSSVSNASLEEFTTNALLHGVGGFAHRPKRHYSLDDLKKLAAQAASDVVGDEGPRHDIATTSNPNLSTNRLETSIYPSIGIQHSPYLTKPQPQWNLNHTAGGRNNLMPKLSSVHPPNNRRALPHLGSDKQDLDPIPSYTSAALEQRVSPSRYLRSFWEASRQVLHLQNRLGDGELSLYADSTAEVRGCAADGVQPDLPLSGNPAVADNVMNKTEALQTIAPFPSDLDDFDRKLLRLGAELAQSESAVMVDRERHLCETEVKKPLRDVGGHWCESLADSAVDGHQTHDSLRGQYMHDVPMDSYRFPEGQVSSKSNRRVPQDPTEGFSGFSRRHILY